MFLPELQFCSRWSDRLGSLCRSQQKIHLFERESSADLIFRIWEEKGSCGILGPG
jgi:hypothetical protein